MAASTTPEHRTVGIHVRAEPSLVEALRRRAEQEGRTVSDVLRRAAREGLGATTGSEVDTAA